MDGVRSNLGWRNSWWMVLWAGAVLHCSFHGAQAQVPIPITVEPPIPMETQEVLMTVPPPSDKVIFCDWFRHRAEDDVEEIMMVFPAGGENRYGPGYTTRETVYPNCSLHIKNLAKNDSAIYVLLEGGLGPSNSGNVTLNVVDFLGPANVVINPAPFLVEFQPVQLQCITTVTHEVSWSKDGQPLSGDYDLSDSNRTLSIASVNRRDSGEYKCQVSNGITEVESQSAYLSVIFGPEVPVIRPNDACYDEHVNIILSCEAASFPEPQYTWFRDDVLLDKGTKLFIENFNDNQAGIYVCEAWNQFTLQRKRSEVQHIRLKKSCVSEVTINGSAQDTEEEAASLDCTAEGDNVVYSWLKGNKPVVEDKRVSFTNGGRTINFNPCDRSDAAEYTCHASNDYSFGDSDPFALTIIYGPDPPFINETIHISENTISLSCVAVAFPATVNVWLRNKQEQPDQVLVLPIDPANSGNYTCRATNPISRAWRETTLEIDMIQRQRSLRRR